MIKAEDNIALRSDKSIYDIASNTDQYFWHTETGTDTGAHITEVPKEDFLADPANGGGNLLARSNGIAVRDGLTELASFGADGERIGKSSESHVDIDYHSLKLINKEQEAYLYVSDLRDENGVAQVQFSKIANGKNSFVTVDPNILTTEPVSATIDGVATPIQRVTESGTAVYFNTVPAAGSLIVITYATTDLYARAFTFGSRQSNTTLGAGSVVLGRNGIATGSSAYAEGSNCRAYGRNSHAEGEFTEAYGQASHAEGSSSTAKGDASHAEGASTEANGNWSHAQNWATTAGYSYQTAMGRHNNNKEANALEVGNGDTTSSGSVKSNALELTWTGKLTIASTLTQNSDRRLKEHKSYLGDDAVKFIDELKPVYYLKDNEPHLGFYAQDVEEADKWDCMVDEMNGYKTLGYTELIAPLVAYCQHLEKRIEALERTIK